ncbi:MAG: F0F1 ATP synthase subunit A [Treponema sp.]|nr:F0F1 ATP synthase subunit A [Treponema sp.]
MDEVFHKLERLIIAEISFGNFKFELSNTLLCVWIAMVLVVAASLLLARKLNQRPGKAQVILEMLVAFIRGMCRDFIGDTYYKKYVNYIGTLFLFLCMANLLSVLNFIPGLNIYTPTKDINVAMPLAIMTILIVLYSSFRYRGPLGTAKSFLAPIPMMLPFNLMEYVTKPLSLCLRLFGNIVAAFVIMELIFHTMGIIAAPFSAYFDFFDGILQAYIFVFLTCLYIGQAVEVEG